MAHWSQQSLFWKRSFVKNNTRIFAGTTGVHLFTAEQSSIRSTHFFNDGFRLRFWNGSKDHLSFLDHLGICFEVLASQFMFQQWKQPEIARCEVRAVWWMLRYFYVAALKPFLHKSSHMQPSIVLMKNPLLKMFWLLAPDIIKESFQYHLVILFT